MIYPWFLDAQEMSTKKVISGVHSRNQDEGGGSFYLWNTLEVERVFSFSFFFYSFYKYIGFIYIVGLQFYGYLDLCHGELCLNFGGFLILKSKANYVLYASIYSILIFNLLYMRRFAL